jgi:microcystin-dependent protein
MAEGYTKNIVINKFVYNESPSTSIQVGSEPLSFDRQNEINSFEYLQGVITFYDSQGETVYNYNIDDINRHNGFSVFLDVVQWGSIELGDGDIHNVPEWGGDFNVYYRGYFEPETTLTLSPSNLALYVGETGTITATTNSQQSITWNSNNTAIATVNSSGVVTAISAGTAIITASVETKTASCTVTVSAPSISEYTLNIYKNASITDIIKSITIPKNEKINKYIYDTGVYNDINTRDGYYISEWKNHDTDAIIQDAQTMVGDLDIYPGYTEIKTKYYCAVKLPDLTQRFPFGAGGSYILGGTGGEENHKLTIAEMPSHSHSLNYIDSNGSSEDKYYTGRELDPNTKIGRIDTCVSDDQYMIGASGVKNEVGNFIGNFVTDTGADGYHNNMPPYLVVNFIIKYK